MSPKTFVDTNILVYAHDPEASAKRVVAAQILEKLWANRRGVLSLQVLQEFYVVMSKKMDKKNPPRTATEILRDYSVWEIATIQIEDLFEAITLQRTYQLSFWDSLIVRAAQVADCNLLLSEDFQEGMRIGRLEIINPFTRKLDFV